MTRPQPHRVLGTIRTVTVGSLAAAALGTGIVAGHLAGDRSSAAASPATHTTTRSSARTARTRPSQRTRPTKPAHHKAAAPAPKARSTPSGGFAAVQPVQPGSGRTQSGTHGS